MKHRWLPFGLILLLAILLTPFFRNIIRELIIVPLLYVFWFARFLLATMPQAGLWTFFSVLFALILGVSLLEKKKRKSSAPKPASVHQGRIESWVELIHKAEREQYFQWRLAQRLQKLTLSAIAHNKGQSMREVRQQLRRGELDLPPQLLAYFQASLQSLGNLPAPKLLFWRQHPPSPFDVDPIQVVQFLKELDTEPTQQEIL